MIRCAEFPLATCGYGRAFINATAATEIS